MNIKIGAQEYDMESGDNYIIDGQDFEPDMIKLIDEVVKPGAVVYDIGANVGCMSIALSKRAKIVHSFEPSPITVEYLKRNITESGIKNICVHSFGIGESFKATSLTYSKHDRSGAFISDISEADAGHEKDLVIVEGIDTLLLFGLSAPDFIKIDVEGYELNILRGARKTIKEYKPTAIIEMNSWCLNVFQRTALPNFIDEILSIFPEVYAIDGEERINLHDSDKVYHVMRGNILHNKYRNLLCGWGEL